VSTVWAIPASAIHRRNILGFLRDVRGSARVVEVRLFRTRRLYDRVPMDRRRWRPGNDLQKTAKEISEFIADSGSAEVTIVATDEV
jgi:hypothetical protein